MSKIPESLMEFMSDGGKYQLARPAEGTWVQCWKREIAIGRHSVIEVEGGYTSTTDDSHTAVINVTVKPLKLANGAEDQANETITVFYKDFRTVKEAEKAVTDILKSGKVTEEDPGVPSEMQGLGIQLATQRAGITIAI
jgi:hypothetical protein